MADEKKPKVALPIGKGVNVACLAKALDNALASYRFLILKIILQHVEDQPSADEITISLDDLRREMLVAAWFPAQHFQLSFGSQDMIRAAQEEAIEQPGPVGGSAYTHMQQVKRDFEAQASEIAKLPVVKKLTQHPVWVMLKPWFEEKIKDLEFHRQKEPVIGYSNEYFDRSDNPPLYKISRDEESIQVHGLWREYFKDNWHIINGWLDHHWQHFLTRRNPYVPHLINKLWDFPARPSLDEQRELWKPYIARNELHCFYSPESIDVGDYELDHFLPWSWVTHDQLWNLIPVSKKANVSKSNLLPPSNLIPALAERHRQFICFIKRHNESQWKKTVEDYVEGLQATCDDLVKNPNIINVYEATVGPQLQLAERQGLKPWKQS